MPNQLAPGGKDALDALLARTQSNGQFPAIHFGATTAHGPIYAAHSGDRVFGSPEQGQVDENTTLQLFSMTKLVTSVAALQLIDRGLVDLDDPRVIEDKLPELCAQEILSYKSGEAVYTPRTRPITLRRLLTHTSGLGYHFNSPELARWQEEEGPGVGVGIWSGTVEGFTEPLLFEPGTRWRYSIGIDWAGILVERLSGQGLEDYFQQNIFKPLGIDDISFIPTPEMLARMQQTCSRDDAGKPVPCPSLRPIDNPNLGQVSGGGGLFGTAKGYLRFLAGILASKEEGGIISPSAFKTLFTNALPPRGDDNTCYADLARSAKQQTYHDPDHVANDAQYLEHSIGLVLNTRDSVNGRKAGSGCWDGAAKTQYWLDPTTGIAGIAFTQLLTPSPEPFMRVYNEFERTLYDYLQ